MCCQSHGYFSWNSVLFGPEASPHILSPFLTPSSFSIKTLAHVSLPSLHPLRPAPLPRGEPVAVVSRPGQAHN